MERDTEKLIIKWLNHKYGISIEDENILKQFLYDLQISILQNLPKCNVSGSLPHPCVDPLFEIKGCDMPKGSYIACGVDGR